MLLTEPAPAKVNLFLHVIGRRADGYHLLDSLVVFPAVGDRVAAEPADDLSLRIEGPFGAALLSEPDNLVLRAARGLAQATGGAPRARLVLEKHLPTAAGIGGGSADAAATLRLLQRLWATDPVHLPPLAAELGADVPVCLASRPARMGGAGEILAPAPALPPCGIALVNPGVKVATAAVFRHFGTANGRRFDLPAHWPDAAAMARALALASNDLQPAAIALCPAIATMLDALAAQPGCLLARMSGSGGTCFGLFPTAAQAEAAAAALAPSGWWSWGGALA